MAEVTDAQAYEHDWMDARWEDLMVHSPRTDDCACGGRSKRIGWRWHTKTTCGPLGPPED